MSFAVAPVSIKNIGGGIEASWGIFLRDLDARSLKQPEIVVVDGAACLNRPLSRSGAMPCHSGAAEFTSTATFSVMPQRTCMTS